MFTRSMTTRSINQSHMTTRSMTKTEKTKVIPQSVEDEDEEDEEDEDEEDEDEEDEELENELEVEILTTEELEARGLKCPDDNNKSKGKWIKVVKASKLDIMVTINVDTTDKWAVAPDGFYWEYCSVKCYYWFDWYKLRKIPL